MSPHPKISCLRLVWRLLRPLIAASELRKSGGFPLEDRSRLERVAVLYAHIPHAQPKALTWLDYVDRNDRRLPGESTIEHQFDAWFAENRDADIWSIATAWHFYRAWLKQPGAPHWRKCLSRQFEPDPFLDEVLACSRGWILWDFQLRLIFELAPVKRPLRRYFSRRWRDSRDWSLLADVTDVLLPDGALLVRALQDRSMTDREGLRMPCGIPDLALAHALSTLPRS